MTGVLFAVLNGFLLGAGFIIAIGPQNAFVLRQGLKREYVFTVSLICALSDALLIAAGVAGLGTFIRTSETLLTIVTFGGALFLLFYGWIAFSRAAKPKAMEASKESAGRFAAIVGTCLAFTFLNPHVYLDTVVLLGSLSAQYESNLRLAYGIGAALASFIWFFALGYGARLMTPWFANPRAWQILDIGIGIVMWLIAARLIIGWL